jgi:hypothetical protein
VVFQRRLHPDWRPDFQASHLFYTSMLPDQCQDTVKLHGVFLSCSGSLASSPALQFHRALRRDSGQVVTLFMQVGTYPTRGFATLGPLELRPPFTGASVQSFDTPPLNLPALGKRRLLYLGLPLSRNLCFC